MKTQLRLGKAGLPRFAALAVLACGSVAALWAMPGLQAAGDVAKDTGGQSGRNSERTMQVFYLEIVTKDVDSVCAAYEKFGGVQFSKPDAGLGNARTAPMPGGGLVGVRAPLRDNEEPVVRPYWLVDDIKTALDRAVQAGGEVAHPPFEIPGHGTFAIYIQGGNDHGLWQR